MFLPIICAEYDEGSYSQTKLERARERQKNYNPTANFDPTAPISHKTIKITTGHKIKGLLSYVIAFFKTIFKR
jgi:hypothetical protein